MKTSVRGFTRTARQGQKDCELVAAFLEGDERAFTELYDRYKPRILRFTYGITRDRGRSEDLTQETFLRVYRSIRRYDQVRSFSSWIFAIAGNASKNELRDRKKNPVHLSTFHEIENWANPDSSQLTDASSDSERLLENRERLDAAYKCVERIPTRYREVWILRQLHGLSYEEIASMTGVPVGTVKSRLSRGRIAFRSATAAFRR